MRRLLPWIVIAFLVLLIALIGARANDTETPFDPRSTGPLGARALVLLLEEFGARVSIGAQPRPGSVALLLSDQLGERQQDRLRRWVRDGGTLVVADPLSTFSPALTGPGGNLFEVSDDVNVESPNCSLPSLRDVGRIEVPTPARYRVREGAVACFRNGRGAYLVARAEGRGTLVALGGGAPFVNDYLPKADNAVMAVGLLAPRPGGEVILLEPDAPGSGRKGVLDLVPQSLTSGLWQLVAAFVFIALWRGRRLGKPVPEPQPVEIAGSELVVAVGNLLRKAGRRDAAAGMLRMQLRRELAERLGLAADASEDLIASALQPFGVDTERVVAALRATGLNDDRDLVVLAKSIDAIRREVTHV